MTLKQQQFRRAAMVGFIFGFLAVASFFLLPIIGLTAAYIQRVEDGTADELLFPNLDGTNAILSGIVLCLIAPAAFGLAAVFFNLVLEAVARTPRTWIYQVAHLGINGAFVTSLCVGALYQYTFMRNPSVSRLDALHLVLSMQFMYSLSLSTAVMLTAFEGYQGQTLPVRVCILLWLVELGLLISQFLFLNPNIYAAKVIGYYFVGSIRTVAFAAYLWLASVPNSDAVDPIQGA